MATEIVIVPTYKRDELLYLCLEAIRKQFEGTVWAMSDRCAESPELYSMEKNFRATIFVRSEHPYYGNSFNALESLCWAIQPEYEYETISIIEDDTILHPGYFAWARGMLNTKRYAAVCGHVGNALDTWYTSPCASWRAENLKQCLELVPTYYLEARTREEMQRILDGAPQFKKSKFKYGSCEQDGFFLRCIEHFGWRTAFPEKPLCAHLGWFGYNRDGHSAPTGNFEQRIQACQDLLANKQRRVELFGQRIVELELEGENA
jgi:hypothetical protein